MKKTLAIFLFLVINTFAGDKNVGFLMNQKYLCINQGALIKNELVPVLSQEDTLKHPLRIKVDENNLLQTDGVYKNLKHIEKTYYGDSENLFILMIEDDQRLMYMSSKEMKGIPLLYLCTETDNWILTK